jgi:soluble lytic murein transglycosylase
LTPTAQFKAHLETAMQHQINGNYEEAIAGYLRVLEGAPTPEQSRQARYHLARSYLLNRDYQAAASAWEGFIARYPEDSRLPEATLMLARAYQASGQCTPAIAFYEDYVRQDPVLADLAYEWIGDCRVVEQDLEGAIDAYRQALDLAADRGVQVSLREKIADAYVTQEGYDAAISEYDAILGVARLDHYRAEIEYLAGQTLAAAGNREASFARYRRAVDSYPEAEYAYLALIELVDAGLKVDEFQRGLVDYHAGKAYPDAFGAAIRAFDRYLAAESAPKADEALYFKALAHRAIGEAPVALETLAALVSGYPESEWRVRAWSETGATLAEMGDNDGAIDTYQALAARFPSDELAPRALWQAAVLRSREGAYARAAELYEDVQSSFPGSKNADAALWQAGLMHYRAGNLAAATADWQALLDQYPQSSYRSRSLYWLGKVAAASEPLGDAETWDQLVASGPLGYYALRVQQIRAGESLTATRLVTATVEPPPWSMEEAEVELLNWLGDWSQVPASAKLAPPAPSISERRDFQRGRVLLAAGLRTESLSAFNGVRAAAWDDPLSLAQLALFFRDQGLHGLAARSAARLAALWPDGTIHDAPQVVRRLAYPLAYADLLSAEAPARDLDPLLLAALVRQESLFEPAAESYAGARGLGQVMPATGEGIARNLGADDFTLDDLYRPAVSIRFGAYYLAIQMNRFDDLILVALAAYNGGPGNTLRWIESSGDDLDLFVETITASQSRRYLQRVYEQYIIYEALYRPATGEG